MTAPSSAASTGSTGSAGSKDDPDSSPVTGSAGGRVKVERAGAGQRRSRTDADASAAASAPALDASAGASSARLTTPGGERGSGRRNRNDVVHAAGRLFAERGFHGTSMRDLGEAMGLLGSSLYAHIGSKNELLVEVIASGAEKFSALADTVLTSGAPPAERLRHLVAGHVRILADNADHAATFLNEARHLEPDQRARVLAWRDGYEAAYRGTLAEGVAAGVFRPDLDPARTATFVLSLLNGVQRWYRPGGTDTPDTIAAQLCQFIERAVAAPEVANAHL